MKSLARGFAFDCEAEVLPFGQKEGNKMGTLFAIGAGEEDDVVREVNSHDGGESWTAQLVKR